MAISDRSHSFYISGSVARLEALDEQGRTLGWGSGFFIEERDFLSLYTCWHVVTGIDAHQLPSPHKFPPVRAQLRVHTLGVSDRGAGLRTIGGLVTFSIDLFKGNGERNWFQGKPQHVDDTGKLSPPEYDCVRIDVSAFRDKVPHFLKPDDDQKRLLKIHEDAYIVGYPYGFSANIVGPDPVFLRRNQVSNWPTQSYFLLNAPGARGMSGGPIVTFYENEWRLRGIYNGALFPEATYFADQLEENGGESRLPLGKYIPSFALRRIVGAPV